MKKDQILSFFYLKKGTLPLIFLESKNFDYQIVQKYLFKESQECLFTEKNYLFTIYKEQEQF